MAKMIRARSNHLFRCEVIPLWRVRAGWKDNSLARKAGTIRHFASRIFYEVPLLISFNYSNLSSLLFSFVASAFLVLPLFLKKVWHMN